MNTRKHTFPKINPFLPLTSSEHLDLEIALTIQVKMAYINQIQHKCFLGSLRFLFIKCFLFGGKLADSETRGFMLTWRRGPKSLKLASLLFDIIKQRFWLYVQTVPKDLAEPRVSITPLDVYMSDLILETQRNSCHGIPSLSCTGGRNGVFLVVNCRRLDFTVRPTAQTLV